MSAPDNINDALNNYKNTVNTSLDSKPLLSDDDIRSLINSQELPMTPTKKRWHANINPVLAIGLVAAAVVVAVLWPEAEVTDNTVTVVQNTEQHDGPLPLTPTLPEGQSTRYADAQRNALPSIPTIQLNAEELKQLGLDLSTNKLTYVDPGLRISIRTNGISAKGTSQAHSEFSPRHISLYHEGVLFASWFDAENVAAVNDLVPIRVHLDDPNSTMFTSADVILWYEPTQEFNERLPGNHVVASNETAPATPDGTISSAMVFPNPVGADACTLRFNCSKAITTSAVLVDVSGRRVKDLWVSSTMPQGNHDIPINDLALLPNGMYLVVVVIDGSNERLIQRLLIER